MIVIAAIFIFTMFAKKQRASIKKKKKQKIVAEANKKVAEQKEMINQQLDQMMESEDEKYSDEKTPNLSANYTNVYHTESNTVDDSDKTAQKNNDETASSKQNSGPQKFQNWF